MSKSGLNQKQELFCREYLVDSNGTQAAIRAGYSAKTAGSQAFDLLQKPEIKARIEELKAERLQRLEISADSVLARHVAIADADTTRLTGHHIGSCRYCWGARHEYQWKTRREFAAAVAEAKSKRKKVLPRDTGGYDYRVTNAPNPECPECAGLGEPYVRFVDTSTLTGAEKLLFESVEQTKEGIKLRFADRAKSLEILSRYVGISKDKVEHTGKDGKPVEHEHKVVARVVMVPPKQAADITQRPMPADPNDGDAK